MEQLLPVLTAWLEDGPEVTNTLYAALEGQVAYLPLEAPPFEQTTHILEVHVIGAAQPFLLLAEPTGFATGGKFPLQLSPLDEDQRIRFEVVVLIGGGPEQAAERLSSLPPPPTPDRIAEIVARPPKDPLAGATLGGGKFQIEQLLGSGAAGRVYKARHRDLQKTVAVKLLHPFYESDPQYLTRFQGEALAASRIDHPNVMRILDFGQEPDGVLYIVMEYLEGRDLSKVIEQEGPLPLSRIVPIAMQICAGLSVAHDAGVIHRDIKPENILLTPGQDDAGNPIEVVKVCDFGIAQIRSDDNAERGISGTPEYMSPEQWQGLELDARTDLYATGVTLYEMATRFVPATGQNMTELMMNVLTAELPPPSLYNADVDPRLQTIIMKALARAPADRQGSARELRSELGSLIEVNDGAARLARRRELLDASKLTPLEDVASGFAEFTVALASGVMRTGYYERNHPEAETALARLAQGADTVLKNRGEISFARRDVAEQVVFTIVTGTGEVKELRKLLPASVYELYADKLGEVFIRRSVISLALRDGLDERDLADLVELLSGPEIPPEELRAKFLARAFTNVSVVFVADLLGRKRRLNWHVDLCVSRLARDLRELPFVRGMSEDERRTLRNQIIGDVVRALGKPELLRSLLDNADLIAAATGQAEERASFDITEAIISSLSMRACTGLARQLLQELEATAADSWGSADGHPAAPNVSAGDLLKHIAARFARDRATDSDDVLRQLYARSFLALPDLPPDLQMWIRAEDHATALTTEPESVLGRLDAIESADEYERELSALEFAIRVLARRGEAVAVHSLVELLRRHAASTARAVPMRERAMGCALVIEEPDVMMCIAQTLLGGPRAMRDSALRLLIQAGAKAAVPVCEARLMSADADASFRARFVAAFRDFGAAGWPVLAAKLEGFGIDADPIIVEDFLRAAPDVRDEVSARMVERFCAHTAPMVRRAAATALAALGGPAARGPLLALLSGNDDGVRLGALAGLRRIKAIDAEVVARIEKIVGGLASAGEELRAASAAALAEVAPDARAAALGVLARAVAPQRKSFVGILKDALAAPQESTMVLVASAQALVAIGGEQGRQTVRARMAVSSGVLKQQLESLLG